MIETTSVREIQSHLLELYGLQVSPDLISTVTYEKCSLSPHDRGDNRLTRAAFSSSIYIEANSQFVSHPSTSWSKLVGTDPAR